MKTKSIKHMVQNMNVKYKWQTATKDRDNLQGQAQMLSQP